MEGLIPVIYRVIIQHRTGEKPSAEGFLFNEPNAAPYIRLPDDSSGHSKQPPDSSPPTGSHLIKGIKSPLHLSVPHHV